MFGGVFVLDRALKVFALGRPDDLRIGLGGPVSFAALRNTTILGGIEIPVALAILLGLVVLAAATWGLWRLRKDLGSAAALGVIAIILGGVSNLFDRFAYGAVIDYVVVEHWQSFNLADGLIVLGSMLILVYFLRPTRLLTGSGRVG